MSSRRVPLAGFLTGVVTTQFVNSALHIAQPLLLAKISGSFALAALFSSFDTAVHMLGTFAGGWPTERFGSRNILVLSTALRGLALLAIPLAMTEGFLTITWAMAWYTVDAFIRGFVDASVHTLPLEMAEHETGLLDRINSRYEFMFELGAAGGPLALGAFLAWTGGLAAHLFIPIGFLVSAMAYSMVPRFLPKTRNSQGRRSQGSWAGLKTIFSRRQLLIASLGLMIFNIYPLRKLIAAFFAKSILAQPAASGIVGAGFAAGGLAGAALYSRRKPDSRSGVWISAGAIGLLALAFGWIPASLWIMVFAAFLFSATNTGARLALTRVRQKWTPLEMAGGVTSASQFGANLASVGLKALIGIAFAIGEGPRGAFFLVAIALVLLSFGQLFLARYL